jgi:hypothetical protein
MIHLFNQSNITLNFEKLKKKYIKNNNNNKGRNKQVEVAFLHFEEGSSSNNNTNKFINFFLGKRKV